MITALTRSPDRRARLRRAASCCVFSAAADFSPVSARRWDMNLLPPAPRAPNACSIALPVRVGPSAGELLNGDAEPGELRGQVRFTLDKNGAVAKGKIVLPDGATATVTGQADGQALTLRLALPNKQVVVAVGAASHDLSSCRGNRRRSVDRAAFRRSRRLARESE